jgi:hypothetical protein
MKFLRSKLSYKTQTVTVKFKVLYQQLPGGTEENQE